jgi:CheY-like chemotaxis protein
VQGGVFRFSDEVIRKTFAIGMPDGLRENVAGVSNVARLKTNDPVSFHFPRCERDLLMQARDRRNGKHTILIADDNADIQAVLGILLRGAGFNTAAAYDGITAVTLASRLRPDLVLMDIALPRMDGLTATRHIRRLPGLERVPIVGCSAYEPDDEDARGYAQLNTFLRKPTDFSTLLNVMQQLLRPIPTGQRYARSVEPSQDVLVPLVPLTA